MKNYRIWKQENNEDELLVEVFNECDILSIQKEFTEKGYKIDYCFKGLVHTFIKVINVLNF